jgi:hypothetical protein
MADVCARLWKSYLGCLALSSLALLTAGGCTVASPPGTPVSPSAQVLPPDARTLAYGGTTAEVLRNPEIADKVRTLFGPDWMPATSAGGQLNPGAASYFEQGGPIRKIRIDGRDYVAVTGCMPNSCDTRRVLLLIEDGGSRLFARLDEGGFAHYYGYGSEGVMKDTAPRIVDRGFNALYYQYRSDSSYPRARS